MSIVDIPERAVTAFIGPSGCGKSTFLRCINRMNDTIPIARVTGKIEIDGQDIYDPIARRRAAARARRHGVPEAESVSRNRSTRTSPMARAFTACRAVKAELDEIVDTSLKRAGLLEEVKDRLADSGTGLSGGQQQRLCIARAIAVNPEVILMDEPCSALDPIATARIEELIDELRENFTIIIVTHSMQQAARVSQRTAFFHLGILVEEGADREDLHRRRATSAPRTTSPAASAEPRIRRRRQGQQ